jgi:membrane protein DedA with SNARE-associated domain
MSVGQTSNQLVRRIIKVLRSGRPLHYIAVGAVVFVAIAIAAILEGDLPELVHLGGRGLRAFFTHYSYTPGYALLYIEESGVPLPAPGDVFVMYVGVHIPHNIFAFILAWLGLVLVVVLGATNLFFISRKFGTRLVHSQFAEYIHLTPERLEKAEQWFKRYGVLAIIFGRHIPGFRVPITVASGVFQVSYRVFAISVAISTAIWAGVMLTLGIAIGPRLAVLLHAHGYVYFIWGGIVVLLVLVTYIRQQRRAWAARARRKSDRPVESPSS